jgi:hypothetical protein
MAAIIYRANGTQEVVTPKNGNNFQLQELYSLLSCSMIEHVDIGNPNVTMIADEEGALRNDCVVNKEATKMFREAHGITNPSEYMEQMRQQYGDIIFVDHDNCEPFSVVGDVLVVSNDMLQ